MSVDTFRKGTISLIWLLSGVSRLPLEQIRKSRFAAPHFLSPLLSFSSRRLQFGLRPTRLHRRSTRLACYILSWVHSCAVVSQWPLAALLQSFGSFFLRSPVCSVTVRSLCEPCIISSTLNRDLLNRCVVQFWSIVGLLLSYPLKFKDNARGFRLNRLTKERLFVLQVLYFLIIDSCKLVANHESRVEVLYTEYWL